MLHSSYLGSHPVMLQAQHMCTQVKSLANIKRVLVESRIQAIKP